MQAKGTLVLALAMVVAMSGCATMRRQEAQDQGNLLAAAGFRMKVADTAERQAALDEMPALKMITREKDGNVVYWYADPYACRCLWVGGPDEYAKYRQLALEKQIADEEVAAAMAQEDAALDWGMWGPWWWR